MMILSKIIIFMQFNPSAVNPPAHFGSPHKIECKLILLTVF